MQHATVEQLARVHASTPSEFSFLDRRRAGETPLAAHTRQMLALYRQAQQRVPLIERGFAWLEDHWPDDEGEAVLDWGDSRIGNMMFDGFDPVAVLDWEMAGIGPRELDVAWLIYGHRIFEDIAAQMGLGGMPHFLRPDDVATIYERLTGHTPRHLDWYGTYAALQYAIVFLRTGARQVHFGEVERPAATDDLIMNRDGLERMLAGTYWS